MSILTRRHLLGGLTATALAGAVDTARGAPARTAIVGATLKRPGQEPLEDAVVVIDEGRVASVGTDPAAAEGAERIDAKDKVLTAGLVDLLTQVGIVEVSLEPSTRDHLHQEEDPDPVRAAFLTADGYNPDSTLVPIARQGGVTSVGVIPRGGLVSGQSAWADLAGSRPADALVRRRLALHAILDDRHHGGFGRSRGTAFLRLRELFDDARAYRDNPRAYDRRQVRELSASRLDLEAVVDALEGRIPTFVHVDRASDILAALKLADEEGLRLVLASAAEAWKVRDAIAEAGVPVVVYPFDNGPRSFAALGARSDNPARLEEAGVQLALSTGQSHNVRKLRQAAGNAVRAGMSHDGALAAVTDAPARIVGLEDHGSPRAGRVANLVLWSGDPFELSTAVERMLIGGREVDLRSRQSALLERYR